MARVTIKDIAREAGVSDATVSLSFQPDSRISPGTRRDVLRIARKFNYVPNLAARGLRYGRTKSIGIIVTEITNPWYAVLIRHAQEMADRRGYQLLIAESRWDARKEQRAITTMAQMQVRGLLFCCSEAKRGCFSLLKRLSLPYIVLDTFPDGYRGSYVENDLVAVGRMAGGHLFDRGCRTVAFLNGPSRKPPFSSFLRLQGGFGDAVKGMGLGFASRQCVSAGLTIAEGRRGMRELLATCGEVDGVFCVNDLCALGAMEAIESAGRAPGSDIAVMGVDDIAVSAHSRISLTSITFPYADAATTAANAILDIAEGKRRGRIRETIAPQLVARDSTLAFRKQRRIG